MRSSTMNRKGTSEPKLSSDRESGFVGLLGGRRSGHVVEIDWNSLLYGKKVLTYQDIADVGVEAPRNSLESSPGTRTPRFSGVRHDDIPFGVEIPRPIVHPNQIESAEMHYTRSGESDLKKKGASEVLPIKTLIAQDSCEAEQERRRRSAPSVVARLMGLEALPDKSWKGSSAKPPKHSKFLQGSRRRESKPHSAKAETSRTPSPLHDVDTIKDFHIPRTRGQTDLDVCEDRTKIDVLSFRAHPQERQLQEFKREFMEKLANERYGITSAVSGVEFEREGEDKRGNLKEKLCEARLALAGGGDESRRLSSAQEKLMESKEFQDAIELLQTNKEFFRKFFPDPLKSPSVSNKDPPEPESTSRRSFHLDDLCHDHASYEDVSRESSRRSFHLGDFSRDSRKSYFLDESWKEISRRSLHLDDSAKESRMSLTHYRSSKEPSATRSVDLEELSRGSSLHNDAIDSAKEIRALDDYSHSRRGDSITVKNAGRDQSASEHRRRRKKSPGPNPVAEEVVVLKSTKGTTLDKGPTEKINGRHGSPNNVGSRKGCYSPSRIVLLKPGPGEITLLTPVIAYSPQSHLDNRCPRRVGFENKGCLRDPRERRNPTKIEDGSYSPDGRPEYRDPRVDPRAIARDIVREARTNSTRELSRERETGRLSPMRTSDMNLEKIRGNSAKIVSVPRYGRLIGSNEEMNSASVESVGSFNFASLYRRQNLGDDKSRIWSSPTAPNPTLRLRPRDKSTNVERISRRGEKPRRAVEKPKPSYQADQISQGLYESGVSKVWHTSSSPIPERNLSPMPSRPKTFFPSSKTFSMKGRPDPFLETQICTSGDWRGEDDNMDIGSVPGSEKILKVKTTYFSKLNIPGGDGIQGDSVQTLTKPKPVQNAATTVATKMRTVESPPRTGSDGNKVVIQLEKADSSDRFFSRETTRADVRQAFLFGEKKAGSTVDATMASSLSSPYRQASQEQSKVDQDVHIDMNLGVNSALKPHIPAVTTRPSSFEHAVPIEHVGARHGSRLCEQGGREAASQRTSNLRCGATEKAQNDQLRKLSAHKQLEVPVKQGSRSSEAAWSLVTPAFENGDGDGASETSVDKCGQPSPVSVLDSPFEVETSSPVEFKELSSDLQDLRLRLRLLKLDGGENRSRVVLGSLQEKEKLDSSNGMVRETENSKESIETLKDITSSTCCPISRDLESHALHFQAQNINLEGLPCRGDTKEDLLYVLNVLVASGFTSTKTMMTKWHSPVRPLDPGLYEQLEDYYVDVDLQIAVGRGNSKGKPLPRGSKDSYRRRLLFDVVNEMLLQLLTPYLNDRPWIQPCASVLRPLPSSSQIVSYTWLEICACFSLHGVEDFEALDGLMLHDLSRGPPWLDSLEIREEIVLELERIIFESLLEETVACLTFPTKNECKQSVKN